MLDTTLLPTLINHYSRLELLEITPSRYMAVVEYLRIIRASFRDPQDNALTVARLPINVRQWFPASWYNCDRSTLIIPVEFFSSVYTEV